MCRAGLCDSVELFLLFKGANFIGYHLGHERGDRPRGVRAQHGIPVPVCGEGPAEGGGRLEDGDTQRVASGDGSGPQTVEERETKDELSTNSFIIGKGKKLEREREEGGGGGNETAG